MDSNQCRRERQALDALMGTVAAAGHPGDAAAARQAGVRRSDLHLHLHCGAQNCLNRGLNLCFSFVVMCGIDRVLKRTIPSVS